MGNVVKIPMGDLLLRDYKTGEVVAIAELFEVKIVEVKNSPTQYQLAVDSSKLEKFGSFKDSAGGNFSDFVKVEDEE